ncbi:unnamed protein product, partial [Vitis vinifera]
MHSKDGRGPTSYLHQSRMLELYDEEIMEHREKDKGTIQFIHPITSLSWLVTHSFHVQTNK